MPREQAPLLWASTYQAGEHVGSSGKTQEVCGHVGTIYGHEHSTTQHMTAVSWLDSSASPLPSAQKHEKKHRSCEVVNSRLIRVCSWLPACACFLFGVLRAGEFRERACAGWLQGAVWAAV